MFHLLRFYSGNGNIVLFSREGSGLVGVELEAGKDEDINFSGQRACIGYRTSETYVSCPNGALHMRQCPTCAARDIARVYTVGDFSGFPEVYEEAKKEEYCLYLAGFGSDIIKCGVTRLERFEERMREQGSDFGCVIASFKGPDEVYGAEEAIQSRFSFANAVRLQQKIQRLVFDKAAAQENFKAAVELVRTSCVLPDFKPHILDFSPFYPKLHSPHRTYSVLGKILGAKGEILLFKSEGGKEFAVNMREQVASFFERK